MKNLNHFILSKCFLLLFSCSGTNSGSGVSLQERFNTGMENLEREKLKKYEQAPFRAPMIVVLVCTPKEHPMVPEIEQIMSTATAGQNILLALNSMGYGGMWRTGTFSLNDKISKYLELDEGQKVVGYLYIGTPEGKAKKIPELNIQDFVTKWDS